MLRIVLILTILAGLGALGVSHLVVGEKVTQLNTDLASAQDRATQAETAKTAAESETKKAKEAAEKMATDLTERETQLDDVTKKHAVQLKRANDLETELVKAMAERNEAQQELASWKTLGIPVEQIRQQRARLTELTQRLEGLTEENTVLARNNNVLKAELDRYKGVSSEVQLPAGLRGKVVAVDPKYDFVVLNLGRKDGLLEHGRLIVNREGRLVGKVEITRVLESSAVANVLPQWKQSDLREGDDVLY